MVRGNPSILSRCWKTSLSSSRTVQGVFRQGSGTRTFSSAQAAVHQKTNWESGFEDGNQIRTVGNLQSGGSTSSSSQASCLAGVDDPILKDKIQNTMKQSSILAHLKTAGVTPSSSSSSTVTAATAMKKSSPSLSADNFQALTLDILKYTALYTPCDDHLREKDEFLVKLQKILSRILQDDTQSTTNGGTIVAPFGSVVNGFWTPSSDIDICLKIPGVVSRTAQIRILKKVGNELSKVCTHYIEPRFGAKIPIIHWAPRKAGLLACDISVNNILAIANSRLVGEYVRLDQKLCKLQHKLQHPSSQKVSQSASIINTGRLHPLGVVVKAWASNRGINDRSRGTLSSFSLILMLIHYLQRECGILPSIQDMAIERSYAPVYVQGVDCRYVTCGGAVSGGSTNDSTNNKTADNSMQEILEEIEFLQTRKLKGKIEERHGSFLKNLLNVEENMGETSQNMVEKSQTSLPSVSSLPLGYLLYDFFRYFAYDYKYGAVAIRDVESFGVESPGYLVVDNPFEIGKDVANIEVAAIPRIRQEFRRACLIIQKGCTLEELMSQK